jgi:hypothetical protein
MGYAFSKKECRIGKNAFDTRGKGLRKRSVRRIKESLIYLVGKLIHSNFAVHIAK